jgi:hypothetical protein
VNDNPLLDNRKNPAESAFLWLEGLTTIILVGFLLALAWITVSPFMPGWGFLPTTEAEVIAVLGLLTAALVLVSVVALLHTRR